jgi:hypothetical protein
MYLYLIRVVGSRRVKEILGSRKTCRRLKCSFLEIDVSFLQSFVTFLDFNMLQPEVAIRASSRKVRPPFLWSRCNSFSLRIRPLDSILLKTVEPLTGAEYRKLDLFGV